MGGGVGSTACIRVMSRWEEENAVHTAKDGFVALDREALKILAAG